VEKTARVRPIPPTEWPPEMSEALAALSSNAPQPPSSAPQGRPRALNVLGMFAHHPALARAYFTFNAHLLWSSSFTPRERELLILRVAAVRKADYEFAQHVYLARDAGLDNEEIERVITGPDAEEWSPIESALLSAVDELIADTRIGDATWATLVEQYDTRQLMDLVFTIGAYELLAMAFGTFDLEFDEDLKATTPHL
jgi:AhpD family alkylhydroperoxidase